MNVVSRALQKSPYWEEKIRELGWEISCGGARWIDYMQVDASTEGVHLAEALEYTQSLSRSKDIGQLPVTLLDVDWLANVRIFHRAQVESHPATLCSGCQEAGNQSALLGRLVRRRCALLANVPFGVDRL